eukprot:NODE_7751_length_1553_cov_6.233520.p1 GENE.NODE_7751_length_1553_cov_6.233520~~NODE_7751_length_1553_cov_6.233520.p1  ORF type:complete len:411 (-),score=103.10 NODE_7751_length_1553_cov_6.233520:319-1371(-)
MPQKVIAYPGASYTSIAPQYLRHPTTYAPGYYSPGYLGSSHAYLSPSHAYMGGLTATAPRVVTQPQYLGGSISALPSQPQYLGGGISALPPQPQYLGGSISALSPQHVGGTMMRPPLPYSVAPHVYHGSMVMNRLAGGPHVTMPAPMPMMAPIVYNAPAPVPKHTALPVRAPAPVPVIATPLNASEAVPVCNERRTSVQKTFDTMDTNGDGVISRSEFRNHVLNNQVAEPPAPASPPIVERPGFDGRTAAQRAFDVIDSNGDGVISRSEFRNHVDAQAGPQQVFEAIDTNHDGVISRSEFRSHVAGTIAPAVATFVVAAPVMDAVAKDEDLEAVPPLKTKRVPRKTNCCG